MIDVRIPVPPACDNPIEKPSAEFYESMLAGLFDGIYFVDRKLKITYWSSGAERLSGYASAEVLGSCCSSSLLGHVNNDGYRMCHNGCPLEETMADGQRRQANVYLCHKLGHRVPVTLRVAAIRDESGEIVGAVGVFSDGTEKNQVERRSRAFEQLAFRDTLTGIPNRNYMELRVRQTIQEVAEFGRSICLLLVSLDRFKLANDRPGQEVGDASLRAASKAVSSSLRPCDLVGRTDGNELIVIGMDIHPDDVLSFAHKVRNLVSVSAIVVDNHRLSITASIGATIIRREDSSESAMGRADEAVYSSKAGGQNRTTVY